MADSNDGGDKTEKPTEKRLKDARKKGDVPKSKEITSTLTLLVWLGLAVAALPLVGQRVVALTGDVIAAVTQPFAFSAPALGWLAAETVLWATALLLVPVIAVGLLVEYLQAGPIFAMEKVTPKAEHLNPAAGIKRMFSMDNVVEVLKAVAKTVLLFAIGWLVLRSLMPEFAQLLAAPPAAMGDAIRTLVVRLLAWTLGVFALVSVLDMVWQRHSFTKKNRMSLRDIRQEMKESEGDPHIKAQRRQTHQEWSQRNAANAASQANVLLVNPTHVAIAIDYDRETCPVPTISAKGEDDTARAMREAAEAAGVPIVRNIPLARDLLARGEEGEVIPRDLFEVMAEVILWARDVREQVERHQDPLKTRPRPPGHRARRPVPGEDLTRYPDGLHPDAPSGAP